MTAEQLGFALRPGVFSPHEIQHSATLLDRNDRISRIFVPDGRMGYESLEVVSSILTGTSRILAGNGVIRLLEHDPALLIRRIQTIQAFSGNRFFLGVGTGTPGPQPSKTVLAMLARLDLVKEGFRQFPKGVHPPEVFIAALKSGIARKTVGKTDGLLLNFCSPNHASSLISSLREPSGKNAAIGCYLKIFFSSKNDETAQRLMMREFLNYDSSPQYHEMFMEDETARSLQRFREDDEWKTRPFELPKELRRISLANPRSDELQEYVLSFRKAGVALPVPYPYFPADETSEFKYDTIRRILEAV